MVRKIIEIDEEKCNGCGACAAACLEGAIGMVNGKAKLLRDDYCDGLGNCLPHCPTDAIRFVEREAAPFDEAAVAEAQLMKKAAALKGSAPVTAHGCPGSQNALLRRPDDAPHGCPSSQSKALHAAEEAAAPAVQQGPASRLMQWPVQIKLLPIQAPFYQGAKLLIAADCTAFSRADFHERFMRNHIAMIGCPKLDEGNYAEKLTEIIRLNDIKEVTVVRMEVPCCGGIQQAVETALKNSGKFLPWQVITLGRDGRILD